MHVSIICKRWANGVSHWEQHKRTSTASGPVDLKNEIQDLMGMTSIKITGSRERNTLSSLLVS